MIKYTQKILILLLIINYKFLLLIIKIKTIRGIANKSTAQVYKHVF